MNVASIVASIFYQVDCGAPSKNNFENWIILKLQEYNKMFFGTYFSLSGYCEEIYCHPQFNFLNHNGKRVSRYLQDVDMKSLKISEIECDYALHVNSARKSNHSNESGIITISSYFVRRKGASPFLLFFVLGEDTVGIRIIRDGIERYFPLYWLLMEREVMRHFILKDRRVFSFINRIILSSLCEKIEKEELLQSRFSIQIFNHKSK